MSETFTFFQKFHLSEEIDLKILPKFIILEEFKNEKLSSGNVFYLEIKNIEKNYFKSLVKDHKNQLKKEKFKKNIKEVQRDIIEIFCIANILASLHEDKTDKQHVIPEVYLKNFYSDGILLKDNRTIRKNIAVFNSVNKKVFIKSATQHFRGKKIWDPSLELLFGYFENNFEPSNYKNNNTNNDLYSINKSLNQYDKIIISLFIATIQARNEIKTITKETNDKIDYDSKTHSINNYILDLGLKISKKKWSLISYEELTLPFSEKVLMPFKYGEIMFFPLNPQSLLIVYDKHFSFSHKITIIHENIKKVLPPPELPYIMITKKCNYDHTLRKILSSGYDQIFLANYLSLVMIDSLEHGVDFFWHPHSSPLKLLQIDAVKQYFSGSLKCFNLKDPDIEKTIEGLKELYIKTTLTTAWSDKFKK